MKNVLLNKIKVFLVIALSAGMIQACDRMYFEDEETGAVSISVSVEQASMSEPALSTDDFSFVIDGAGPGENTFHVETAQGVSEAVVGSLVFGSWDITVQALYGEVYFGVGSATIAVNSGSATDCPIVITPSEGQGTLDITVNWDSATVQSPVLEATLSRIDGYSTDVSFAMGTGQATASVVLDSGIYSLSLVLKDGDTYEYAGAADSIRIINALTTSVVYTLDGETGTGSVSISISINIPESIDVTIEGASETLTAGSEMALTASAPEETGSLYYFWYLNGRLKQEGGTYTVPATLTAGPYRVDLIIFNDDYSRSGAASVVFTVVEE